MTSNKSLPRRRFVLLTATTGASLVLAGCSAEESLAETNSSETEENTQTSTPISTATATPTPEQERTSTKQTSTEQTSTEEEPEEDKTTSPTNDEGSETVVVQVEALDQYTGTPARNVTVTGTRHESGPDGEPVTFEVSIDRESAQIEIPEGTYEVTFSGEAYEDVTVEREVTADGSGSQIIGVELLLDIPEHEVTVTVDDATGEPIDGGKVHLDFPPEVSYTESPPKQVVPIENGTAITTIPAPSSGDATHLRILVDGCNPMTKTVFPEEDTTVAIQLECEQ